MVSSRLRLIAVAAILSIFLFYNFSNRYDYSYPETRPWNGQSQAVTAGKVKASIDYNDSEVAIPTPTGAGRGAIRTQAATLDSEQEDLASSAELEAQKLSASASSYSNDHADDKTGSTNGSGSKPTSHQSLNPLEQDVDWSRFAYTQYVTDSDYLCNSVMIFETLYRLGSKADRVMMYPYYMLDPEATESDSHAGRLLIKSRDEYQVKLMPIEIQFREGADREFACHFPTLIYPVNMDMQLHGPTPSPSSLPSTKPNMIASSHSTRMEQFSNLWTSSFCCRRALLRCLEPTGC